MKFLVDAQLPKSLSDFFIDQGHDSIHTAELPKANRTPDNLIITIASKEKRIVVSKDDDFLQSYLVKSQPEKLLLVKTGNIRNSELLQLFLSNLPLIITMLSRSSFVEISQSEITEHN